MLRTKTVEYAFQINAATLNTATRFEFPAITIWIPETTRTFRSVAAVITYQDNVSTATAQTSHLVGVKLGGAAFSDHSKTTTSAVDGEQISYTLVREATSYFQANFGAGVNQTCQIAVQFGAISTCNHCAKLIITYEYDDAATTRLKTVRVPIESTVHLLSNNAFSALGNQQIPALDSWLPESNKTYRNIFIESFANEFPDTGTPTTLFSYSQQIDTGVQKVDRAHQQALGSARHTTFIWLLSSNDFDTSTSHNFRATAVGAARGLAYGGVLNITYEYDHGASNTILNSLALPLYHFNGYNERPTHGEAKFFLQEPGTYEMRQSGVIYAAMENRGTTLLRFDNGPHRPYNGPTTASTTKAGQSTLVQRLDSGGELGIGASGFRLTKGLNSSTVTLATHSGWENYGGSFLVLLNYTSDKHADGDGAHAHTTLWCLMSTNAYGTGGWSNAKNDFGISVPERFWYANRMGAYGYHVWESTSGLGNMNYALEASRAGLQSASTNPNEVGNWFARYAEVAVWAGGNAGARAPLTWEFLDITTGGFFQQYDGARKGEDIRVPRNWQLAQSGNALSAMFLNLTYHSITCLVSGSVSGYTGDGSGITVNIHRADTHDYLLSTSTVTGGLFSTTWYDTTLPLYAHARQDATHVGRSDDGTAS